MFRWSCGRFVAPLALGLHLPQSRNPLSTPGERRRVTYAHMTNNQGILLELLVKQRRRWDAYHRFPRGGRNKKRGVSYFASSSATPLSSSIELSNHFEIVRHCVGCDAAVWIRNTTLGPSSSSGLLKEEEEDSSRSRFWGFQCLYKETPSDFVVREIDENGEIVRFEKGEEEEGEVMDNVCERVAKVVEEGLCMSMVRLKTKEHLSLAGKKRRQMPQLKQLLEEAASKTNEMPSFLEKELRTTFNFPVEAAEKKKMPLPQNFENNVLSLLWRSSTLSTHLPWYTVSITPSSSNNNTPSLLMTATATFSSELHALDDVLGRQNFLLLRGYIGDCFEELATDNAEASNGSSEENAMRLRLPWVEEHLIRVANISGVVLGGGANWVDDPKVVNGKRSLRTDLHTTTHKEKEKVVRLVWSLLNGLFSFDDGASSCFHSLTVNGDRDFLYVKLLKKTRQPFVLIASSVAATIKQHQNELMETERGVELPATLPLTLMCVEFVLEIRGLPFKLVEEEILFALEEAVEEEKRAAASTGPRKWNNVGELALTTTGVVSDSEHSWSFQRVRVRASSASLLRHIAQHQHNVAKGLLWRDRVSSMNAATDCPGDGDRDCHAPNLTVSTKRSSSLRSFRSDNYAVGHSHKGHRHTPTRRQDIIFKMKQNADAAPSQDEIDFWRAHFYKIHSPRIIATTDLSMFDSNQKRRAQLNEVVKQFGLANDFAPGQNRGYAYNVALRYIPHFQCAVPGSGTTSNDSNCNQKKMSRVEKSILALQQFGFLNYFGPERFGTTSRATKRGAHPGLHLLMGQYRAAASLLVGFSEGSGNRKETVSDGDGRKKVIAVLKEALHDSIAGNIGVDGGEEEILCRSAFHHALGRKICRQIVHEFLAFCFNEILTQRVKRFGAFVVLEGDLVAPKTAKNGDENDADGKEESGPVFVTAHDIEEGRFTPFDVLLPIPGISVVLPANSDMAAICLRTMEQFGIHAHPETQRWEIFAGKDTTAVTVADIDESEGGEPDMGVTTDDTFVKVRCGNALGLEFSGGYRRMIERPRDFSFSLIDEDVEVAEWQREQRTQRQTNRENVLSRTKSSELQKLSNSETQLDPLVSLVTAPTKGEAVIPSPLVSSALTPNERERAGGEAVFPAVSVVGRDGVPFDNVGGKLRVERSGDSSVDAQSLMQRREEYSAIMKQLRAAGNVYWLKKSADGILKLNFALPASVYPSMMIRELCKFDNNAVHQVGELFSSKEEKKTKQLSEMSRTEREQYDKHVCSRRKQRRVALMTSQSRAMSEAVVFHSVFKSGGMRKSLLPSPKGYSDVT